MMLDDESETAQKEGGIPLTRHALVDTAGEWLDCSAELNLVTNRCSGELAQAP